jgi:hypothetical protein
MKKGKKISFVERIVEVTCIGIGLYIVVAFSIVLAN